VMLAVFHVKHFSLPRYGALAGTRLVDCFT